jgi:hypothetical protein
MSRPADDRQANREAQAKAVRNAMPADMLTLCDELKDIMSCRLTHLQTPALTIGQPDTQPGLSLANIQIGELPARGRKC